MGTRKRVMDKNLALAQKLSADNNGALPNVWKLIQMGHGGLYRYMQRHPKEFKKFRIQKGVGKAGPNKTFNVNIRNEHIQTATELVEKHGKIPTSSWLRNNGFTRLASYMRNYPRVFSKL